MIPIQDENIMWEKGVLGISSPSQLLKTAFGTGDTLNGSNGNSFTLYVRNDSQIVDVRLNHELIFDINFVTGRA